MPFLQDRDLIDVLCDLNKRFNTYGGKIDNVNVLDRYQELITHSEHGKACGYARKYREMFIEHDYEDVKRLILEAAQFIKEIDGEYTSIQKKEEETSKRLLSNNGEEE